jgi:ubiquitin-protein ligase
MISHIKCLNYRYNKWTELIESSGQSIVDYFGLSIGLKSNEIIHMDLSKFPYANYCIFTFYYTTIPKYKISDLPNEIINRIYDYYKEYLVFQFKIEYGERYPFSPPIWSLYSYTYKYPRVYDKKKTDHVVKAYCNGIINCHNSQYKENWSPVIMIHSDLLAFYMILSNFRDLIHKLQTPNAFSLDNSV